MIEENAASVVGRVRYKALSVREGCPDVPTPIAPEKSRNENVTRS